MNFICEFSEYLEVFEKKSSLSYSIFDKKAKDL